MRRRLRNTFSSDENAQDQPSADAERQQDAAITSDGGATFQFTTWTVFVVQVWLLDFGRPFFSLYLPGDASLSALSISKCFYQFFFRTSGWVIIVIIIFVLETGFEVCVISVVFCC